MPLSDPEVISRLNRYFIPVYVPNADFRTGGAATAEERAELQRIHREGHAARLSVGTVHAYALSPEGRLVDSLHVADAFRVERLTGMLDRVVERLATRPGAAVVAPRAQSAAAARPGSILLHVTSRYLERRGGEYRLIRDAGGNWSAFPGEDWIELEEREWRRLLPADPAPGREWEPDRETMARLLRAFYPPTENNDPAKSRIEEQAVRGVVVQAAEGGFQARLTGRFRMKHPFYHRDDGNRVEADLLGWLELAGRNQAPLLQLVTGEATYGDEKRRLPFGTALRTVQPKGAAHADR